VGKTASSDVYWNCTNTEQNSQHRSIFAKCYLDDSIRASGYIKWSGSDNRINRETLMAEFENTGPGFNAKGRAESKLSHVLSKEGFEPYSTPEKVYQWPFQSKFGNTAWIDKHADA
jgi:hypothetical protein